MTYPELQARVRQIAEDAAHRGIKTEPEWFREDPSPDILQDLGLSVVTTGKTSIVFPQDAGQKLIEAHDSTNAISAVLVRIDNEEVIAGFRFDIRLVQPHRLELIVLKVDPIYLPVIPE